jgi:nicotinamidase-related amidase
MVHVADTVPYAWPYDGELRGAGLALVVCGAQRDLAAVSASADTALEAVRELAAVVRSAGGDVVWGRHGRRAAPGPVRSALPTRGTSGWELIEVPAAADVVIDAAGWDGCFSSELEHLLRSRNTTHLALGGLASELTVDSTVRTLNDRGFECLVLTDGCAPIDLEMGRRAHHSLTMSGGIFGALGTTRDLAAALDRTLVPTISRSAP